MKGLRRKCRIPGPEQQPSRFHGFSVTAARDWMAKIGKRKTSRKCRVPLDWNVLSDVQKFNRVFAIYKSVTGGWREGNSLRFLLSDFDFDKSNTV